MAKRLIFLVVIFIISGLIISRFQKPPEPKRENLACTYSGYIGEIIEPLTAKAIFEGKGVMPPALAGEARSDVLGLASSAERWVEVDLSEQKLRAWEGDQLFLETRVSTGLPGTPTPTGEFRVWIKLRATKM